MIPKFTEEEYVERLINKRGTDHYDYSNIAFTGAKNPITITCKKCGFTFSQIAGNHMSGHGCPACYGKKKNTMEDLKEKITKVTPTLTNIEYVEGTGLLTKFNLTCSKCTNSFQARADLLIHRKQDCPVCTKKRIAEQRALSTEEFIARSTLVHKGAYDYANSRVLLSSVPVEILCKKCNTTFLQAPHNHMRGTRCSNCYPQNGFRNKDFFVGTPTIFYVIQINETLFKYGITSTSIEKRYQSQGVDYTILFQVTFFNGETAWNVEKLVQQKFKAFKYRGLTPFKFTKTTECLTINPVPKLQNLITKALFLKEIHDKT